jgi:hypothetical protein
MSALFLLIAPIMRDLGSSVLRDRRTAYAHSCNRICAHSVTPTVQPPFVYWRSALGKAHAWSQQGCEAEPPVAYVWLLSSMKEFNDTE